MGSQGAQAAAVDAMEVLAVGAIHGQMGGFGSFETYSVVRKDRAQWALMLETFRVLVANPTIRVVDIRRERDRLTVVFRRLEGRVM